jgi:hypothetical protein
MADTIDRITRDLKTREKSVRTAYVPRATCPIRHLIQITRFAG